MNPSNYIHPAEEAGKNFYQQFAGKGSFTMLNFLRFREVADYSGLDTLKPSEEISGEEAYRLYMKHTLPLLKEAGSEVTYFGTTGQFLIGPESEKWDEILLVKHQSAEHFIAFAQNEAYLKTAGHRTAALADSRLLPITEKTI